MSAPDPFGQYLANLAANLSDLTPNDLHQVIDAVLEMERKLLHVTSALETEIQRRGFSTETGA
jgi:hypothetical protein